VNISNMMSDKRQQKLNQKLAKTKHEVIKLQWEKARLEQILDDAKRKENTK